MSIHHERDHILRDTKDSERSSEWPYDSKNMLTPRKTPFVTPWEDEGTDARLGRQQLDSGDYPYNQVDLERESKHIPTPVSDMELKGRLLDFLSHESQVDQHGIEIKVLDGDVTFSGWVRDHWMKLLVEGLAEQVPGVKKVINNIQVDPDPDHHPF